jgi:hydratase-aldolase
MLTPQDLHGIMTMMPAFATPDADRIEATSTVAVDNLAAGVDRIIKDGINVISTTGSFGEFHTLLADEFKTIVRASIEAVAGRVPLFIGCTSLNSRETVNKMRIAREAGAQGVLVGVPFYFPSTIDNAVRFYSDIASLFPELAIMIYHNPPLHNVTLSVSAFERISQIPNVVAMKDSHRTTTEFMKLMDITKGKISVFVNTMQYYPFAELGAPGFWNYDCWMGPAPVLALREAVARGDSALATRIILDIGASNVAGGGNPGLQWRETASKLAIAEAGYCQPGPLRPPFVEIPESVRENARKWAAYWQTLCAKYATPAGSDALVAV